MCFSATGSFGVAAVLVGIGTVAVVQNKASSHRLLAAIPLLFAAQQIAEGVVWVTIHKPGHGWVQLLAVALFLGFALVVWPTWVPVSLLAAETNPRRRKILSVLVWIGVGVSMYAGAILIRGRPYAHAEGHSLAYSYTETGPSLVLALYLPMYILPSVIPFFVSTVNHAKLMGSLLALSLVATFMIKRETLTSVWCFFAAVLSGVIVLGIASERRLAMKMKTA